jgi:multidrug efflux system outer membrane protein
MQINRSIRLCAVAAGAVLLFSGCAGLAPKPASMVARLPAPHLPERYPAASDPSAQEPSAATWWHGFGDPALVEVLRQTARGNVDLRVASARVAQAQALLAGTQAAGGPSVDLDASLSRARGPVVEAGQAGPPPSIDRTTTTARLGARLNWEWDVFGRQAQALSASQQRLLSRQAAEAATALTVTSEAARIVIEVRALQQQLRLTKATLAVDEELADVAAARQRAGLESSSQTSRAQASARGRAAQLQQQRAELALAQQALAVLAGVTPEQVENWLGLGPSLRGDVQPVAATAAAADAPPWLQPAMLAAGLPADLLRRRADIVQAEASLRAASDDLAAATAERWPRLNLAAGLGWVVASAAGLGTSGALAASIAPAFNWRVWDGGAAQALTDERSAQEREALAAFTQTVLRAFAEAATAMAQLEQRRAEVAERAAATRALAAVEEITSAQYRAGLADWVSTQEARRASLQAQSAELLARQQQTLANVTLYRALGGGWQESLHPTL